MDRLGRNMGQHYFLYDRRPGQSLRGPACAQAAGLPAIKQYTQIHPPYFHFHRNGRRNSDNGASQSAGPGSLVRPHVWYEPGLLLALDASAIRTLYKQSAASFTSASAKHHVRPPPPLPAMFHLGHPDILPVGDLGVRKGMQHVYGLKVGCGRRDRGCSWEMGQKRRCDSVSHETVPASPYLPTPPAPRSQELPTPERMEQIARAWAPWRSVGSAYMWCAAERAPRSPGKKRTPTKKAAQTTAASPQKSLAVEGDSAVTGAEGTRPRRGRRKLETSLPETDASS